MIPLLIIGAGAYLIYDSQRPQKMAKGGTTKYDDFDRGGISAWENNGFIDLKRDSPQEWQLVEWSLNGHSPSFKGKMYSQSGTGFIFIQKEDGEIYNPKPSNKLFWRPINKKVIEELKERIRSASQTAEITDDEIKYWEQEDSLLFKIISEINDKYPEHFIEIFLIKRKQTFSNWLYEIDSEKMAKGGAVKRFVEMRNGKPIYALKDAIFHVSYGKLNDKGAVESTGTARVYRDNTGLKRINDYKKDKDYYVVDERLDDEGKIWHIDFVEKNDNFTISFDRDDLYEDGGKILDKPVFTFKTNADYEWAKRSGYIDDYDIARIEVKEKDFTFDYPAHSEEQYYEDLKKLKERGAEVVRTYQDKGYYDIREYYDEDDSRDEDDYDEYSEGGDINRQYVMFIDSLNDAELMGMGGSVKVKFKDKVKSISKSLKGRKVPKRLQKEYGKTYDKKWERDESARRIAGSQLKKIKE